MKMRRFISALAALTMSVSCFAGLAITANAANKTATLSPTADTYLDWTDDTAKAANYGTEKELKDGIMQEMWADGQPGLKDNTKRLALFKFNIKDYVGKITSATLTLSVTSTNNKNREVGLAYVTNLGDWSETDLTYGNSAITIRSTAGNKYADLTIHSFPVEEGNKKTNAATSIRATATANTTTSCAFTHNDLVTFLNSMADADGNVTLAAYGLAVETTIASKENDTAANRPKLELTYSDEEFADYTIKYVDESDNELKSSRTARGVVGAATEIVDSDKLSFKNEDNTKKYIYKDNTAGEENTIASGGSAVVKVIFREAATLNYSIKENVNNTYLVENGSGFEGDNGEAAYSEYIIKNDDKTIYHLGALSDNNRDFNYLFELTAPTEENQTPNDKTLTYTVDTDHENPGVFLAEFEDLADKDDEKIAFTPSSAQSTRTSRRGGADLKAADTPATITTLPAGKYKITVNNAGGGSNDNQKTTYAFNVGESAIPASDGENPFTVTSQGYYSKSTSGEFTIKGEMPITVTKTVSSATAACLDLILIEKTGEVETEVATPVVANTSVATVGADGSVDDAPVFSELGTKAAVKKLVKINVTNPTDNVVPTVKIGDDTYAVAAANWDAITEEDGSKSFYIIFAAKDEAAFADFDTITVTYGADPTAKQTTTVTFTTSSGD